MRIAKMPAVGFIWLLSSLFGFSCHSQGLRYERAGDEDLVYIMNRIECMGRQAGDDLILKVMSVENVPGSAGQNSCEVSHDIYLAISEYDELPEQSLFILRDVLYPKVERLGLDNGDPVVYLSVGVKEQRQVYRVKVTLEDVSVDLIR